MKPHALPLLGAATRSRQPLAPRNLMRALRIIHPFPTLLNVAATAGLAFVAAHGTPDASTLIRMLAVMFCAQSAIGVTNDVFDRDLDAAMKPWKPVASGVVPMNAAIALAFAFIAATAVLASTLGAAGFALAMLGMSCGLVYDAWLKRSLFSVVPFMVAIPTLPLFVWASLDVWDDALWWLLPLGALIGVALHLANTLPDIDDDARFGVRGLAHRLGARGSMRLGWTSFGLALALSAALAPVLGYEVRTYVAAAAFGAACLAASIGLYLRRGDAASLQAGFGALGVGSAVVAVGWLAAVT